MVGESGGLSVVRLGEHEGEAELHLSSSRVRPHHCDGETMSTRGISTDLTLRIAKLVNAALDQRHPSPDLVRELNNYLTVTQHPARLVGEP